MEVASYRYIYSIYNIYTTLSTLQVPGLKVIGVSGASSKRPRAPAFVWMTEAESSWAGLQSIIPNMLHLGRNRKYLERTFKNILLQVLSGIPSSTPAPSAA